MGRVFTLSFAILLITGQTGVLAPSLAQTRDHDPAPAAYAVAAYDVADGSYGQRIFVPRRYIAPTRCPPNPNGPGPTQLDPGLRYLGPCESAPTPMAG
jgi:hypothetical protein